MKQDRGKTTTTPTNGLKTGDNSANSYSTESDQQEQDSGYKDGTMSLKSDFHPQTKFILFASTKSL